MKTLLKKLCVTSLLLAIAVLPLAAQTNDSTEAAPPPPASNAPPQAPKAPAPAENSSPTVEPTHPGKNGSTAVKPAHPHPKPVPPDVDNRIAITGPHAGGGIQFPPGPNGFEVIVAVSAILIPFVFLTGIVAIIFEARRRKNEELHQTLRLMIEKGVPIPPELLTPRQPAQPFGNGSPFGNSSPRAKSDLRSGLVWIAVGIGVWAFLGSIHSHAWPLGLIFVLMGGAFLLTYKLEKKEAAKSGLPPK